MTRINAKKLARNTLYAGVQQVWTIGSRFVLTPIIIDRIGLEGYGTWALLFGICAYVSMFDTSFSFAYCKFTAEYDRRRDYDGLSQIIGSGIAVVGSIGLIGLAAIWLFRTPILHVLKVPDALMHDAGIALLLIAAMLLLRMSVGGVFQVLAGLQRLDLQYKLQIAASIVEFATTLAFLTLGWGLLALAYGYTVAQLTATLGGRIYCWRLCPALSISPLRASRRGTREVLSLGGRFQLLFVINTAITQGLRLLISGLCGVAALGVFELAFKLVSLGTMASGSVISPLMPAFANLRAGGDTERRRLLYEGSSKLVAIGAVVAMGFLALYADQAIVIWTNHAFPLAAWTIRVVIVAELLSLLTGVATSDLRGAGLLRLEMQFALLAAVAFAASVYPGYRLAGYEGLVIAVTGSRSLAALWFLWTFARGEGFSFAHHLRETLARPLLAVLPAVALVWLAGVLSGAVGYSDHGRWLLLGPMAVLGVVYTAASAVMMWFAVLSKAEREIAAGLIPLPMLWRRSAVPREESP